MGRFWVLMTTPLKPWYHSMIPSIRENQGKSERNLFFWKVSKEVQFAWLSTNRKPLLGHQVDVEQLGKCAMNLENFEISSSNDKSKLLIFSLFSTGVSGCWMLCQVDFFQGSGVYQRYQGVEGESLTQCHVWHVSNKVVRHVSYKVVRHMSNVSDDFVRHMSYTLLQKKRSMQSCDSLWEECR